MPQPLSKTRGANGKLDFGSHVLSQHPEQAYIIAQVVSTWAYVEASLGNLLACFLRADATIFMEMYGALNGFTNQRMILEAAARTALSPADQDLLADILTVTHNAAKQRHCFAHRIWATCDLLPKCLLLIEPKHIWSMRGRQRDFIRPLEDWSEESLAELPEIDRSKIYVWNLQDFERTQKQILACEEIMWLAEVYFEPVTDGVRAKAHDRLYLVAEMKMARKQRLAPRQGGLAALPELRDTTDYY